jgi:hypothetical protein
VAFFGIRKNTGDFPMTTTGIAPRETQLDYEQAAQWLGVSEFMLKRAAARRPSDPRRLRVKRYGHRTVKIPLSELTRWDNCRIS